MLHFLSTVISVMPPRRWISHLLFCLVAGLLMPEASPACSVPVFRYGLEHWTADPYRVLIVHRGPLSPEAQTLAQSLKDASARANVTVATLDTAQQTDPQVMAMVKAAGSPESPTIIAQTPKSVRDPQVIWSGLLTAENITALLESPARKTIAERLGDGESAVFMLLESGDKAADDAAADLLESRLTYLASVLQLPKLDEQDIRNGLVSVPPDGLHLAFSVVRISRGDAAEQAFISMLLATEPDLKDASGPIAFPVFGQGRALYALVGKGIKHETIDTAASFLIGSCSCQVKEQNPGADLLMAVDWKGLVRNQAMQLKDLPAASEIVGGLPETVKIAPQEPAAAASSGASPVQLGNPISRTAIASAVVVISIAVLAGFFLRKKRA
jgi:hypothetical protein